MDSLPFTFLCIDRGTALSFGSFLTHSRAHVVAAAAGGGIGLERSSPRFAALRRLPPAASAVAQPHKQRKSEAAGASTATGAGGGGGRLGVN